MSSTEEHSAGVVLFEDEHLMALNKPPGLAVQDDRTGDPSVLRSIRGTSPGIPWGLPHRLDRPVSGVLLLAKDALSLHVLGEAFRAGRIQKTYWAIVEGHPAEQGDVEGHFVQDGRQHKARIIDGAGRGRKVSLAFDRLAQGDRYALLAVRPLGGAFHQIRALLAHAGMPIRGDVKYGARRGERGQQAMARSIALHARRIDCEHPVHGTPLVVVAPPPDVPIWNTFVSLLGPAGS